MELNIIVFTENKKDMYLNLILKKLSNYFNLNATFLPPSSITLSALIEKNELIFFDDIDISKISDCNLYFVRTFDASKKFIFMSKFIDKNIENKLYSASIDYIFRKDFSITSFPPKLIHIINLIFNKQTTNEIKIGAFTIDIVYRIAVKGDKKFKIPDKEFLILIFLYINKGK